MTATESPSSTNVGSPGKRCPTICSIPEKMVTESTRRKVPATKKTRAGRPPERDQTTAVMIEVNSTGTTGRTRNPAIRQKKALLLRRVDLPSCMLVSEEFPMRFLRNDIVSLKHVKASYIRESNHSEFLSNEAPPSPFLENSD